jgi:hypothetical protein
VRRVVFPLLLKDSLPVPEVTQPANFGTTGLAAPAEAVPGPVGLVILGRGLPLVAVGAGFGLHGSGEDAFSVAFLPSQESSCQAPSLSR